MHNFNPFFNAKFRALCGLKVPFLSKFIHIYDFGGGKGAAPPCLRKFCIWWAKFA